MKKTILLFLAFSVLSSQSFASYIYIKWLSDNPSTVKLQFLGHAFEVTRDVGKSKNKTYRLDITFDEKSDVLFVADARFRSSYYSETFLPDTTAQIKPGENVYITIINERIKIEAKKVPKITKHRIRATEVSTYVSHAD